MASLPCQHAPPVDMQAETAHIQLVVFCQKMNSITATGTFVQCCFQHGSLCAVIRNSRNGIAEIPESTWTEEDSVQEFVTEIFLKGQICDGGTVVGSFEVIVK